MSGENYLYSMTVIFFICIAIGFINSIAFPRKNSWILVIAGAVGVFSIFMDSWFIPTFHYIGFIGAMRSVVSIVLIHSLILGPAYLFGSIVGYIVYIIFKVIIIFCKKEV